LDFKRARKSHDDERRVNHGRADTMVPAGTTTDYQAAVADRLGTTTVDEFFRVFMMPGMDDCSLGPGPDRILQRTDARSIPLTPEHDVLVALEQWVERGVAPDYLIASKVDHTGAVTQTRLICPEPNTARYLASGCTLNADSWSCARENTADTLRRFPESVLSCPREVDRTDFRE
jgi:feruloyl esterase